MESGVNAGLDGSCLFKKLSVILEENPTITEYDFIIGEADGLPFVLAEDKLGIEFKTIKFMSVWLNEEFSKLKRISKDVKYSDTLEKLTKCLLLCISDNATAWNVRKDFTSKGKVNPLDELNLSALILSRNPKSSEVFFHRKWLLQQSIATPSICDPSENVFLKSTCERCKMLKKELDLCSKCSSRHPNNQPAWNHRFWALNNFTCHQLQTLEREIENNTKFLSVNLSDNSAFNYRRNLLTNSMRLRTDSYEGFVAMVTGELRFICDLLNFYDGFESLWCHKRFVVRVVVEICQRKACLSEVRKSFADLAREVAPDSSGSRSRHSSHSHYRHGLHRHYNHRRHNHVDEQSKTTEFSTADLSCRSFEFLEKFPEEIESRALNELIETVKKEIKLFKMLKMKFQEKYIPSARLTWPDLIARRYVGWLSLQLRDFNAS